MINECGERVARLGILWSLVVSDLVSVLGRPSVK